MTMRLSRYSLPVLLAAFALSTLLATPAHAVDVEQLSSNYQAAVQALAEVEAEQESNAQEIAMVEIEVEHTQALITATRERLGRTAAAVYKESYGLNSLIELVFTSSSFTEAVMRFDQYAKVQAYYAEQTRGFEREQDELESKLDELEQRKAEIEQRLDEARSAADEAQRRWMQAIHVDGARFHQVQGNGSNCGATSFTVGLNILLGEERYSDNVKVWEGAGFKRDSTNNLALRGRAWLLANGLSDKIGIEELPRDIKKASQLREQLEQGNVVVISSGPGSVWQRADGTKTRADAFPSGHWIVFYYYEDGVFYANDSSVKAKKGAGCPYDETQMQQWLDGRGNHFATVMYTK